MIKDFKFHSPAPVYFGHETVKNNAELIASYGKRCYITTTRFPAGCYDVLMKNVKPGRKVVVVGGGMTGCELAYDLAAYEHCDVTLVEALDKVMSSDPVVPHAVHDMLLDLLDHFNVKVMTGHAIAAVNDEGAVIKSMADGSEQTLEADTVVMAIGLRPRADMTSELAGSGIQVFTTGDGLRVGNIRTCVSGAYEIARNI